MKRPSVQNYSRSENMRRIRGKDTVPERVVRRLVYSLGYRYRLYRKDLPGKPDLVFPGRKKVIFIHGCFWHQHLGCNEGRLPKTNKDYWQPKLERNVARDSAVQEQLASLGWDVLVLWECETKDVEGLRRVLIDFLGAQERGA